MPDDGDRKGIGVGGCDQMSHRSAHDAHTIDEMKHPH